MARAKSGRTPRPNRIVFSDLDGTLLDHDTYCWAPAIPALKELKRLNWPLILCSSKTAAEMIPLQEALQTGAPFIVENGGAIYIPQGYFETLPNGLTLRGSHVVLPLGKSVEELTEVLRRVDARINGGVITWMELSPEEIARETGLSLEEARLSQQREFDIPFRLAKPSRETEQRLPRDLETELRNSGLRLTRGGRYFHVTGAFDKGVAVRRLLDLYRRNGWLELQSIGLGDSVNDLSLLLAVDVPVQIPNPASAASLHGRIPHLISAPAPGPEGWNRIILAFTEE